MKILLASILFVSSSVFAGTPTYLCKGFNGRLLPRQYLKVSDTTLALKSTEAMEKEPWYKFTKSSGRAQYFMSESGNTRVSVRYSTDGAVSGVAIEYKRDATGVPSSDSYDCVETKN